VPEFHYQTGYKLYSSFEHSDAMALDGYIEEQDAGPRVDPGSTDAHVEVALSHSLIVLADILMLYSRHFEIDRPDATDAIAGLLDLALKVSASKRPSGGEADGPTR
jgi:hypothetical protein